jgi:hypothetical protein
MKSSLFFFFLLTLGTQLHAQTPVTVAPNGMNLRIGGSLQTRVSFLSNPNLTTSPESQYGFGLRRARVRLFADLHPGVRMFMQLEGAGTSATLLDLRGEWDVTSNSTLRFGRFVGAQPRGMAFTLMYEIDAIDRPAVMEHWSRSTSGADSRIFGAELVHRRGDLELRGLLHNGDNTQNFRNSISESSPTGGSRRGAMATAGMVRVLPSSIPHSDFGAHVGYNPTKSANALNRTYMDWSAHAYWGDRIGTQSTRLKFDAMGILYSDSGPTDRATSGFSLLAARLIHPDTELFARVERLDTGIDETAYVTAGASYRLWNWSNKLTAAWSVRNDLDSSSDPVHIFTIQSQFHF